MPYLFSIKINQNISIYREKKGKGKRMETKQKTFNELFSLQKPYDFQIDPFKTHPKLA